MKLVALAVLAAALVVPQALAAKPTLNGTVGPGFTITLTQGGKKVSKLEAGTYVSRSPTSPRPTTSTSRGLV
jgi:hypothetical protein